MADLFNTAMLVAASIAAMAFGIWSAFAVLRIGFWLMRPQRRVLPVKVAQQPARVL